VREKLSYLNHDERYPPAHRNSGFPLRTSKGTVGWKNHHNVGRGNRKRRGGFIVKKKQLVKNVAGGKYGSGRKKIKRKASIAQRDNRNELTSNMSTNKRKSVGGMRGGAGKKGPKDKRGGGTHKWWRNRNW